MPPVRRTPGASAAERLIARPPAEVREDIRFARTTATEGPDGLTYTIEEHPSSPQFTGFRPFVTSAGGQPRDAVDFTVRFEDVDLGVLSGVITPTRLALEPNETAIIPIRRR